MPDLLLELFSEEIPARMQAKAEADLAAALEGKLKEAGLRHGAVTSWSGPRRLGVHVAGVAAKSDDVREERKGPKVGAPDKAIEGFLRGAGLASLDQAEIRKDEKKGDFYIALIETLGRAAGEIIAEAVPEIIRSFHWPKSMRTGDGELRWVRPLQRITCLFGAKVVKFEVGGIESGNTVEGHRVHGRGPFRVKSFADYCETLEGKGHVKLTREARRELIETQAKAVCEARGLRLIEDKGLLEEVTGLAEWPVVILGDMDPAFLDLPPEVIQLSMRTHQKYFAVEDAGTGKLAPHFIVVANIEAADGGAAIAAGNSRVLSARLNDARFFWEKDKALGLEAMASKLASIAFKEELGSIADKVERVAALARELAPKVGADPDLAERAARLCKADLVSGMVGEFPELQGVMGRYYALEAGEDAAVATAIAEHYKPQGPSDAVPGEPVAIAVALADKLDTLVGFWAIDEKPTGSKDPFALRRAALGVVRIVLENGVRFQTMSVLDRIVLLKVSQSATFYEWLAARADGSRLMDEGNISPSLLAFFAERLKQVLRDEGKRHDLIDAVFALGEDDLVLIVKRVEALTEFLASEDGANLLAGYKRAANILRAEEKKGALPETFGEHPSPALMQDEAERALLAALEQATPRVDAELRAESFAAAMSHLAALRAPADEFFETVMVNTDDAAIRANRLNLLAALRAAMHKVADFSKIEG